ncbi:AraC family transcriptional regulator [Burkholderia pseudomallei]|nr:AraC family transcriptional regulator [Burkholderia pseudomallei]
MCDVRCAMCDVRCAMCDGRWAMGDGRWAMGDVRWAMARRRRRHRIAPRPPPRRTSAPRPLARVTRRRPCAAP